MQLNCVILFSQVKPHCTRARCSIDWGRKWTDFQFNKETSCKDDKVSNEKFGMSDLTCGLLVIYWLVASSACRNICCWFIYNFIGSDLLGTSSPYIHTLVTGWIFFKRRGCSGQFESFLYSRAIMKAKSKKGIQYGISNRGGTMSSVLILSLMEVFWLFGSTLRVGALQWLCTGSWEC